MEIIIIEAGYPIRESKCWSVVGMRGEEVFHDAIESVKREVKDVKIIAASGSGRHLFGDVSMTSGHSSVSLVKPLEYPVNRLHESVRPEVRFGRRLSDLLLDVVLIPGFRDKYPFGTDRVRHAHIHLSSWMMPS